MIATGRYGHNSGCTGFNKLPKNIPTVFGTFKEGESEVVGQDDRKRLSIKEQWLFPLRPWLEKRGAARG